MTATFPLRSKSSLAFIVATSFLATLTAAPRSSNIAAANDSVKCFRPSRGGSVRTGSAELQREVWSREGLGSRERRLVAIACVGFACTAEPIIEQVHAAFEAGEFTIDE